MNARSTCAECGRQIVKANDGEWIHSDCQMMHAPKPSRSMKIESIEIARMVLLFPDMLSALKKAKDWIETEPVEETLNDFDRETHASVLEQINAAIKKATQP